MDILLYPKVQSKTLSVDNDESCLHRKGEGGKEGGEEREGGRDRKGRGRELRMHVCMSDYAGMWLPTTVTCVHTNNCDNWFGDNRCLSPQPA